MVLTKSQRENLLQLKLSASRWADSWQCKQLPKDCTLEEESVVFEKWCQGNKQHLQHLGA